MIANAALPIADDAIQHAADLPHPDLQAALLGDLAGDGLARRLAQLDQAAREAPLAVGRCLAAADQEHAGAVEHDRSDPDARDDRVLAPVAHAEAASQARSEEHTSELQSLAYLVCRLLLEK